MILEDKDPTLRLSARSWLQDSKYKFERIIDPLMKEFMRNCNFYRSQTGRLFFEKPYNADYVKENFAKLKNILLTTQEEFMEYILVSPYTEYIGDEFEKIKECLEVKQILNPEFTDPEAPNRQILKSHNKYIRVIVYLTLQFIMGHYVKSSSNEMYQETQIVNATASEFMELVIRSIG